MKFVDRIFTWITASIPGFAIALYAKQPIFNAVALTLSVVAAAELVIALGRRAWASWLSPARRICGRWINHQVGSNRFGIFEIKYEYSSTRLRIDGDVYDENGDRLTGWNSLHVEVQPGCRELYYIYCGTAPGREEYNRANTYGLCFLSFEATFRRGQGYFTDDTARPRTDAEKGLKLPHGLRQPVATRFRRLDEDMFREIGLSDTFRFNREPRSIMKIVAAYAKWESRTSGHRQASH